MANRRRFAPGLLALLLAASAFPARVCAQQATPPKHYIPEELRATDPEIRQLLDAARDAADTGDYDEAAAKAGRALTLARAKGFVGDRALAETTVAEAMAAKGKLAEAQGLYQSALQDAVDSSNPVLESTLLAIFAAYSQMGGKLDDSLSLLAKAVDVARKSQNVYAISSALGSLARLQLLVGKAPDARKALEEALRIDSLNQYDDLKALHQVYFAYLIGVESPKDIEKPFPQVEEAINTAISSENYYALALGLTGIGAMYVYEGKPDKGLPILDGLLDGKLAYGGKTVKNPRAFQAALQLPFIRGQVLESLATMYGLAGKQDQALAVWTQLLEFSQSVNSPVMKAEAAQYMADIYRNRGDVDQALHYYGLAADGWRAIPNEAKLFATLTAQGDVLLKNGRGKEGVSVLGELVALAEKGGNHSLEFIAALQLGNEYAREGNVVSAIDLLERADKLVSNPPADLKVSDQSLLVLYFDLVVQYEKGKDTLGEVIALEKGIQVADRLKDDAKLKAMFSVLRGKLDALKAWESADAFYQQKNYRQALVYSEMLDTFGLTKVWKGDAEDGKNMDRLLRCPGEIVREGGGPQFLEANLQQMGPLLGPARNAISRALEAERQRADAERSKQAEEKARLANEGLKAGQYLESIRRPEVALEAYLRARRLADESGDWIARYWARRDLASLYSSRGDFDAALEESREAVSISEATGRAGEQSTAWALISLSDTLQLLGEDQEALKEAQQALRIAERLGDKETQLWAYDEIVTLYGDRTSTVRDFPKALEAYQAGQALASTVAPGSYRPSFSSVLEVYFQTQQYDTMVSLARKTIQSCQKAKDQQCEAHAWMSLAEGLREQRKLAEAEEALKKAEPLVRRADDFYTTGRLYYSQAGLAFKEGHYQQAVDLYLKVVSMLEKVQGGGSPEQQKAVQESYAFIYDDLIAALFALREQQPQAQGMDIPATALESAEASKANGFLSSWGRVFVREMRRKLPAETQEEERALVSKQQDLAAQLAEAKGGRAERLQKDYAAATEQLDAFIGNLRKSTPSYAAVRFPEPMKVAAAPILPGETVVEFKVTDSATFVWMIRSSAGGPEVVAFYKVPQTREWLNQRILRIREAYNRGSPEGLAPGPSAELFRALFPEPYAQQLRSSASITFIPDDILFLIPFEMLSPDAARGEYGLAGIPTRYYPSLAALRLSRVATHPSEWQESFLGVGDPVSSQEDDRYALSRVFNPNAGSRGFAVVSTEETKQAERAAASLGFSFSRLPGTAVEVREIAKLFPRERAETRLGAQATKQLVLETDLSRFRYLHFATHGFLPVAGGKLEPALVLSYDGGDPKQMFLPLSEILQLHLNADMVVLSACNTGSGSVTRADGVANLGRAFMAAGASSATVSLWSVADKSTALLMEEYYRNLAAGKSKAESLARARAFIRAKGYSNPYYWAAFVLMGD